MDDLILDNQTRQEIPVDFNRPEPGWKNFFKNKKIIFSAIAAVIVIAGIFWYFLSNHATAPNLTSTNVILQVKGPTQLTSGNEAEFTVVYRNGENADLVNVSLEMLYPNGFKFKSASPVSTSSSGQAFILPIVKQGQDGFVVIRGNLAGSTGQDQEIKARLHYRLSNFNSEFMVERSIHTSILPPDLTMDINGPVDVVNGQDTTYTVNFTNVTAQNFDNLAVQLTYPAGFSFTSSNLKPVKNNNFWNIAHLPSGSSGSIEVTGSFSGDLNSEMLVRADLGQILNNAFAPQITATATFKIIASSLAMKLTATPSNYVKLGDTINYKLNYINQGNIGLSNLVITVTLQGPALDMTKISAQDAIITGNTITWKAASNTNLAILSPNEQGDINFSVPLRQTLNTNLTNQSIVASASVTTDEIIKPTKTADLQLKLITKVNLDVTGNYISGAAPMQVGKTTLFAITYVLSNLSNDLSDTDVIASMPLPSSDWKNVIIPQSESTRLSFDPNSGKIKWHLGTVAAFTGKFIPALTVTFQIEVTPTGSDQGRVMTLLKAVQATATDAYVNQPVQTDSIVSVDSASIEDDVLNIKGTTVQ